MMTSLRANAIAKIRTVKCLVVQDLEMAVNQRLGIAEEEMSFIFKTDRQNCLEIVVDQRLIVVEEVSSTNGTNRVASATTKCAEILCWGGVTGPIAVSHTTTNDVL